MNKTMIFAALAVSTLTAPAWAQTIVVAPGEGAQERLQEALILAQPGDTVELGAGRFVLTDGLSLDVDGVTVKGAGQDASVLDFTGQLSAGEGLLVTSDKVTLRDFAVENSKGDGIKSKGADNIVYARLRVEWTGGPKETNGAYGVYPVESVGVLIDGVTVRGASDAGIYVGQSKQIIVRNSVVEDNVAGIEIENSRNADVKNNFVHHNTGGILVFDLPNLPNLVNEGAPGGSVGVYGNTVIANNTPNFAPKGNIVASVRKGTGIMVMANEQVDILSNMIVDNATASILIVSYPLSFKDPKYDPSPRTITVRTSNRFVRGGDDPQYAGGKQMAAAFGGALPPVVWDGLGKAPWVSPEIGMLSLGLPNQGADVSKAIPQLADKSTTPQRIFAPQVTLPKDMEARARP